MSGLTRVAFSGSAWADSYYVQDYGNTTLYFYPENLINDANLFPWVENVSGPGINQRVKLYFNGEKKIGYLSLELGYAPLRDHGEYYYKNNRPSKLRISFSDGSYMICDFPDQPVEWIVDFPCYVTTEWVELTILDVYYGRDNDTCIYKVRAYK